MVVKFNDDKETRERVLKAVMDNDGYCPCRVVKNEDTRCMCKEFREQTQGLCRCELYEKIPEI